MTIGTRARNVAAAAAVVLLGAGLAASRSNAATATAKAPAGAVSFSAAQATTGNKAFNANCASCHGANLEGGVGPALSGATLNTLAKNTKLSVGDMFTFISQQMPLNAPASLSHDQYAAIMAYILKYNGYAPGASALTYDKAKSSKTIIHSSKA